jgi:hypothetical protein
VTEIAILVPVLARPHKAAPLAQNIQQTTTVPYHLVFVCSPTDDEQILACTQTGAFVLIADWYPGPGDYARKTNLGYRQTSAPFVFTGADDLDFQPGWAEAALERIEAEQAGVCGTDDCRNPMVKSGKHSTHSLVRRSYVDEQGGTFDAPPGRIFSEVYDHQYVDTELVAAAKARGQWAFSPESRVVHEHPFWNGRRGMDATYEKALARGREDGRLFQRRQRAFLRARRAAVRA